MMKLLSKIKTVCLKRYFASSCRGASRARTTLLTRSISASLKTLVICSLLVPSIAFGAVGFGAITSVTNVINPTGPTVTGSDTVGIVFVAGDDASDSITSVTWGGVAMTKINSTIEVPGDRWISAWCVSNPASAAEILFNDNTDNYWRNAIAYYTGTQCPADAQAVNSSSASTTVSAAPTVVDADSWLVGFHKDGSGGKTYSLLNNLAGGTVHINADAGGLAIADSNAAVGSGVKVGTFSAAGNASHGVIVFSLAPASAPAASSFQLWSLSTF